MPDDSTRKSPDRRDFVRRLLASAAVVPPAFAMLGASPAERRQAPFEKARALLRNSRRMASRAKGLESPQDRRKILTELMEMEREVKSIAAKLPRMEMERLTPELTELKTSITQLKRGTD